MGVSSLRLGLRIDGESFDLHPFLTPSIGFGKDMGKLRLQGEGGLRFRGRRLPFDSMKGVAGKA